MKLRTTVVLRDDKGQAVVFGPESDVPAWAVERITNPKAWADESTEVASEPGYLEEPPRHGKGSGLDAWQEHARVRGLTDEDLDGLSRDDIITLLDSRED